MKNGAIDKTFLGKARKCCLLSVLFFLSGLHLYSQKPKETPKELIEQLGKLNEKDTNAVFLMNRISTMYARMTVFNDSCILWADSALKLSIKQNFTRGIANSYYQIGRTNINMSQFPKAIENFYKALGLFIKINDLKGMADVYLQVGVIMFNQKNYDDAISNFSSALENYNIIKDSLRISMMHYLIGFANVEKNRNLEALPSLIEALRIKNIIADSQGIAECNMAMGNLYLNLKRYAASREYFNKAYTFFERNNTNDAIVVSLIGLGKNAAAENSPDAAEKLLMEAYEGSLLLNRKSFVIRTSEALYKFYKQYNNFEKAYYFQEVYRNLVDSVYNFENAQAISALLSRIEGEKKQSEIKVLERKQQKQKIISYFLAAIVVLITALAYTLYRKFKFKKEAEKKLSQSNAEINQLLLDLKAAEQQLIQTEKMASLGRLTSGIAHELRNPMNFISNFAQLSAEMTAEFISTPVIEDQRRIGEELKVNFAKINKHSYRADRIIKSMLLHSRIGEDQAKSVDINMLCNEFIELAYNGMKSAAPGFECNIFKNIETSLPTVTVIPQDIIRILLNLLNNAFYAVNEKKKLLGEDFIPVVIISTALNNGAVQVSVKDNGTGIGKQYYSKIFTPFFTTKPSGSGIGLGLNICQQIIQNYKGKMIFSTLEGEGTVFSFFLPIEK